MDELCSLDPQAGEGTVRAALSEVRETYATGGHGVELVEIAQGWQFLSRREYAEAIDRAQFALRPRRLSPAALETLAIIAYRSEEHTSELQSQSNLVCRLLLEKKKR